MDWGCTGTTGVRTMDRFKIEKLTDACAMDVVRELFREYETSLNVDLEFQSFEDELRHLPGKYAPPRGSLLVAFTGKGDTAGCVAIRELDAGACEMKRLYVRPPYRGCGLGRTLAQTIVEEAAAVGYFVIRLDTLDSLRPAMELYRSLGFKQTNAYYSNPLEGVVYWERRLREVSKKS